MPHALSSLLVTKDWLLQRRSLSLKSLVYTHTHTHPKEVAFQLEEEKNGTRMRTATVMSQVVWPNSLSSKGTLPLSAGDLCSDWSATPALLGGDGERKGGPFPVAAGRVETYGRHGAVLWDRAQALPHSPNGARGHSVLRWPRTLSSTAAFAKFSLMTLRAQASWVSPL